MVAILGFNRQQILEAVQAMYTDVADDPFRGFHFPTGRAACVLAGYPEAWLDVIPATAVESFAGVGFPFRAGVIGPGDTVLDVGAGAGTDVFCAARATGPTGKAIGLDMTGAMLAKLRRNIAMGNFANTQSIEGNAEEIPLADGSVDAVTSNGVLNLVPDKARALSEIHRVLRPGGKAQIADIVLATLPGENSRANPKLWAECVVGAVTEETYLDTIRAAGFAEVTVLRRWDYFAESSSADTRRVAGALGAVAIELKLEKAPT